MDAGKKVIERSINRVVKQMNADEMYEEPDICPEYLDMAIAFRLWDEKEKNIDSLITFFSRSACQQNIELISTDHEQPPAQITCEETNEFTGIILSCIQNGTSQTLANSALEFAVRCIDREILTDELVEAGIIEVAYGFLKKNLFVDVALLCLKKIAEDETYSDVISSSLNIVEFINLATTSPTEAIRNAAYEFISTLAESDIYRVCSMSDFDTLARAILTLIESAVYSGTQNKQLHALKLLAMSSDVVELAAFISQTDITLSFIHANMGDEACSENQLEALRVLRKLLYHSEIDFLFDLSRVCVMSESGRTIDIVMEALNVLLNFCDRPERICALAECGWLTVMDNISEHGVFQMRLQAGCVLANIVTKSNPEMKEILLQQNVMGLLVSMLSIDSSSDDDLFCVEGVMQAILELSEYAESVGRLEDFHALARQCDLFSAMEDLEARSDSYHEDEEIFALITRMRERFLDQE